MFNGHYLLEIQFDENFIFRRIRNLSVIFCSPHRSPHWVISPDMPKKRVVRDPQDEIDAQCKLLCDEAGNHMKVRNYTRALSVYEKVSLFDKGRYFLRMDICTGLMGDFWIDGIPMMSRRYNDAFLYFLRFCCPRFPFICPDQYLVPALIRIIIFVGPNMLVASTKPIKLSTTSRICPIQNTTEPNTWYTSVGFAYAPQCTRTCFFLFDYYRYRLL